MVIRCAVVDDDQIDLQRISKVFFELSRETSLEFKNEYLKCFDINNARNFDLFVLDIDMPDINGFQLANRIFEEMPKACIIFCTNHDDLVFDAFKLNPFYFVRKSFLQDDLKTALRRFIKAFAEKKKGFVLQNRDSVISIPFSSIVYFEVMRNDLFIHTSEKEYKDRKSMKQLLSEMPPNFFIPINQNYLVNAEYIKEISSDKVILKSGIVFKIPRRNSKEVKDRFALYLLEK